MPDQINDSNKKWFLAQDAKIFPFVFVFVFPMIKHFKSVICLLNMFFESQIRRPNIFTTSVIYLNYRKVDVRREDFKRGGKDRVGCAD